MKATELRLGNYAQDQNGNLLKVVGLIDNDVHYSVVDREKYPLPDGWQAEPILINDKWLLRLGFRCRNLYTELRYENGPISFTLHPGKLNEFVCFAHQCSHGHIKYVHQLQNLCFSLMGVELDDK